VSTNEHRTISRLWLPEGYLKSWGLHVEHKRLGDAGPFNCGEPKLIWHTTESPWNRVDQMWQVLSDKDASPHFIIGGRPGLKKPVVIQCIPLTRSARALAHPAGTPETNRARCIQVEICGYAKDSQDWSDEVYKALANLTVLVEHRVEVERKSYHLFRKGATRLSPDGFVRARSQHLGHQHVPNNDHFDPGGFDIDRLFKFCAKAPNDL